MNRDEQDIFLHNLFFTFPFELLVVTLIQAATFGKSTLQYTIRMSLHIGHMQLFLGQRGAIILSCSV